jgi:hypothetical protein
MGSKQKNEFFISGRVKEIILPQRFSEKMSKSSLILEVVANGFKNDTPFEFINDKMGMISSIKAGDWVNIEFIIKGKRYVDKNDVVKFFTSLEGISCMKED